MEKKHLFVLFLASGLLAGSQAFADDMEAAVLSNTCAGCHGTDGASAGEAPVIAGLSEPYLASAMKNYADGTRYSTIMGRIAKGYDPGQILDMSKFYAAKPWVNADQKVDSGLAAKGQQLHMRKGCIGCHGAHNIDSPEELDVAKMMSYPRVAMTAGASTSELAIREVLARLEEAGAGIERL